MQSKGIEQIGIGITSEDWETKKIKDVTLKIFSGGTPNTQKREYWDGNLPWLSSGETRQIFIRETEKAISSKGVENSSTRFAQKEDVVVAAAGQGYTRGQVSFLQINTYINQSIVALRADKQKILPFFLFYNLLSRYDELRRISDAHSSRGSLTTKLLADLDIHLPTLEEQGKISKILSSLDLKIELNQRMNKTLGEMGGSVFKHWFIDFEFPNEEGRPYKSSGGEMVYNPELEKGIPQGWRVGSLLDCANILGGGTPRTDVDEYWGGEIAWISARDVANTHGIFIMDTEKTITQSGLENSNAKLLPKNTTVITARGTVGNCCILSRDMAMNQTNYGLRAKPTSGDFFVFFSVLNLIGQMKRHSYGTIFDTITTKTFDDVKISIPYEFLIRNFEEQIRCIMNKILLNQQESRALLSIRDSILPKLLSGKLRVPVEST